MPTLMLDPKTGMPIPRDDSEIEIWLAVHGESASGKAWLVGLSDVRAQACFVPKSLCELGPPCGGFERWNNRCQRVLIPIHLVSMPRFKAIEKRLVEA